MKFLFYVFICVFLAVVFYTFISLIHSAFVHLKACIIRRKLSKFEETEKNDD